MSEAEAAAARAQAAAEVLRTYVTTKEQQPVPPVTSEVPESETVSPVSPYLDASRRPL